MESPNTQHINKLKLYLWELALFINKGNYIHRFDGNHIQGILVVGELDVLPVDIFQVVLLLLQLENVANEELLQVLICKVDAQLLKTTAGMTRKGLLGARPEADRLCLQKLKQSRIFCFTSTHLLIVKFSKPKMSSRPIDLRTVLFSVEGAL